MAGKEYYASFTLGGEEYYALTYDTLWEINKQDKTYRFVVAHNQGPMQAELNAYQKRLEMAGGPCPAAGNCTNPGDALGYSALTSAGAGLGAS